jgi:uncharacterized protein (DUF433 family)
MARANTNYLDRISQDPAVMVGKPVVRGTRIPVERVVEHLAYTPDFEDLFAAYPELSIEDIQACLAYAAAAVRVKGRRAPARALAQLAPARA